MHELGILKDLVVIFIVAVATVAALRRVGLPSIAGFIFAGVLLGPNALGLVADPHDVEMLAEIGVVLLLFGIGLELSLDRLRRLLRPVLVGGALQMVLTVAVTAFVAAALGLGWQQALFVGFLIGVSSTAVVLRGLQARGELESPHGRLVLGVLIFQDLSVVPMMLVIPLLARTGGSGRSAAIALALAAALLAAVLLGARVAVPWFLRVVARTRERDLFVLTVAAVCLATAWVASSVGVSLALGAFLAGLIVAGSEFRTQALADMIPFRELLASLFFVSVGMLVDPRWLLGEATTVGLLLLAILLGKALIVFVVAAIMRLPLRVAVLAGLALAQAGEFSFVLLRAGEQAGLVSTTHASLLATAIILSLFVTPLALAAGPRIATRLTRYRTLARRLDLRAVEEFAPGEATLARHVIIAGYGVSGEGLAQSLRASGIPYVVVDFNPANVRRASKRGDPAVFGDITAPEVLELVHATEARELVLAVSDSSAVETAVETARRVAPQLTVIVRARFVEEIERLRRAGAHEVICAELEAAVELSRRLLERRGLPRERIDEQLAPIRAL